MNLEDAKSLLGDAGNNMSDEQILRTVESMNTLANIIIDSYLGMTPEERKKYKTKNADITSGQ